jgi:hypothetical protein
MIITLCGSARFEPLFKAWNEILTLRGHTVFDLAVYPSEKAGTKLWYTDADKRALDIAHKRKINASEGILVLNHAGYVGQSTLSEIEFAQITEKPVYYLEQWALNQELTDVAEANKWDIELPYKSPLDSLVCLGRTGRATDLLSWYGNSAKEAITYLKSIDAL